MKGQNLIIVMIKPFQSTNYGSSLEGEVFPVDTEKVFWRHIIGGLLSMRLQQAVYYSQKGEFLNYAYTVQRDSMP